MKVQVLFVLCLLLLFSACASLYTDGYSKPQLVDSRPDKSTKKLHRKLHFVSQQGFGIGHQDATSYGVGWIQDYKPKPVRSDVFDVAGDYPAVYGFDIGSIEHQDAYNLDSVPFDKMRKLMIDAFKKGGIITVSWHADNPTSGGDSWDQTPAVADILAGGETSQTYQVWLDRVAKFLKSVKFRGKPIPMVFRPYHEMNGFWFWWGDPNCTAEDYKTLWRYTVDYLRNQHNLHNLLYAYSPNKLDPDDDYMKYYPGDDYVDILGIDIYDFNDSSEYVSSILHDLEVVKYQAQLRNKLYAFTETGLEAIPKSNWYTEVLYPAIQDSGIAWILFWRNARETHHYMPYRGHLAAKDFEAFKTMPKTLFLKDIEDIKD